MDHAHFFSVLSSLSTRRCSHMHAETCNSQNHPVSFLHNANTELLWRNETSRGRCRGVDKTKPTMSSQGKVDAAPLHSENGGQMQHTISSLLTRGGADALPYSQQSSDLTTKSRSLLYPATPKSGMIHTRAPHAQPLLQRSMSPNVGVKNHHPRQRCASTLIHGRTRLMSHNRHTCWQTNRSLRREAEKKWVKGQRSNTLSQAPKSVGVYKTRQDVSLTIQFPHATKDTACRSKLPTCCGLS